MTTPRIPRPGYWLFAAVIFCGSFLLFVVQPLIARQALPLLGGAPAVWNSAMVVFQLLLLGGYFYAHLLARLPAHRQGAIHLGLLALAALTLPIGVADIAEPSAGMQALWVPALFVASIGPVFLLLSAQASLIQRWYADSSSGRNPYRLYAISNLGSFAGLAAYPFVIEPFLTVPEQSWSWSAAFIFVGMALAMLVLSRRKVAPEPASTAQAVPTVPVPRGRLLLWIALAAVPSGLMLSTTTLLTTDLMAMPLLWVIPLGLYLLSFTVAFSDAGHWTRIISSYAPVLLLVIGGLAMISGGLINAIIAVAMVALLFILSVALHGRLYETRPAPERLTLFYLFVALGGVLGGAFVAILAPLVFDWIYEHVILLLAAALLLPHRPLLPWLGGFWDGSAKSRAVLILALLLAAVLAWQLWGAIEEGFASRILFLSLGVMAIGILLIGRRWAFTSVFAMLLLAHGGIAMLQSSATGERSRSYFGVYAVETVDDGQMRRLTHGTTMHGEQWLLPDQTRAPTAYYGPTSGAGIGLEQARPGETIGVVGLGVGALACYRKPGQNWTFFEIDPEVARYSADGTFTFLRDCAPEAQIAIGDARLKLAAESEGRFDLLVLDAFSSDAIPLHLMTREAFDIYDRALAEDGVVLVHISNRFVDLAPTIAALARDRGWSGMLRGDRPDLGDGVSDSDWIALARDADRLRRLRRNTDLEWEELPPPAQRLLSDDNASLLALLRF